MCGGVGTGLAQGVLGQAKQLSERPDTEMRVWRLGIRNRILAEGDRRCLLLPTQGLQFRDQRRVNGLGTRNLILAQRARRCLLSGHKDLTERPRVLKRERGISPRRPDLG